MSDGMSERIFHGFRQLPTYMLISSFIVLPLSLVLTWTTARFMAVPYAYVVLNQFMQSGQVINAQDVVGLRHSRGLAFVMLSDKNGKVIFSEPSIIPEVVMMGDANQFVEKHGWSMFRVKCGDVEGNTLSLATFGSSRLTFDMDSALFGPSPQMSFVEILILIFYQSLLMTLVLKLFYTDPMNRIGLAVIAKGSQDNRASSILASRDSVPWYWPAEIKQLQKAFLLYLEGAERAKKESSKVEADANKWRSKSLEIEKAAEKVQQESFAPRVADSTKLGSMEHLREELVRLINERLGGSVVASCFIVRQEIGPRKDRWQIESPFGLNRQALDFIERADLPEICEQLEQSNRVRLLGNLNLSQMGLDGILPLVGARAIVSVPLVHNGRWLGFLLLLMRDASADTGALERMWHSYESSYFDIYIANLSKMSEYVDAATGLYNRLYVQSKMKDDTGLLIEPVVLSTVRAMGESEVSALPDTTVSALLLEFSKFWLASPGQLQQRLQVEPAIIDEGLFVLLLRGADMREYKQVLNKLSAFMQETLAKVGYSGTGIAIGVCNDTELKTRLDMLQRAIVACEYGRSQVTPGGSALVESVQVPRDFQDWTRSKSLKGKLGVFDAAEILQSLGSGQRTGKLVVDDRQGRSFKIGFDAGKPVMAQLSKDNQVQLQGADAICEYITTYSAGDFQFTELPSIEHPVGAAPLPQLMNILMDAALALDNMDQARRSANLDARLRATLSNEARGQLMSGEQPSRLELETMQRIEALCSGGGLSIQYILDQIEGVPTSRKWHCLALMQKYKLLVEE